jgi:acyl dehydratase
VLNYGARMKIELFYEDLTPGRVFDLGSQTVTREEVIEFASEFDPQPFHLDETAGKESILGGLAASGWHTASMVMRLLADNLLNRSSCQGSPGINELKWRKPVYPDDTLSARATVMEQRELKSRPDLGLVMFEISAANQNGVQVLNQINPIMFVKRAAADQEGEA